MTFTRNLSSQEISGLSAFPKRRNTYGKHTLVAIKIQIKLWQINIKKKYEAVNMMGVILRNNTNLYGTIRRK